VQEQRRGSSVEHRNRARNAQQGTLIHAHVDATLSHDEQTMLY
jgi:hypothetical protein